MGEWPEWVCVPWPSSTGTSGESEETRSRHPASRLFHSATLIGNKLYVIGGTDKERKKYTSSVLCIDLEHKGKFCWKELTTSGPAPNGGLAFHSAVDIEDTQNATRNIFCFGGRGEKRVLGKTSVFNVGKSLWWSPRVSGRPPGTLYGHTATAFSKNEFILIGGHDGAHPTNEIYFFNFEEAQWSTRPFKGVMPSARYFHTATLVSNKIYVFGGFDGKQSLNDLHVLDVERMTWEQCDVQGAPPSPRCRHRAVACGNKLIIVGGTSLFGTLGEGEEGFGPPCEDGLYVLDTDVSPPCWQKSAVSTKGWGEGHSVCVLEENNERKLVTLVTVDTPTGAQLKLFVLEVSRILPTTRESREQMLRGISRRPISGEVGGSRLGIFAGLKADQQIPRHSVYDTTTTKEHCNVQSLTLDEASREVENRRLRAVIEELQAEKQRLNKALNDRTRENMEVASQLEQLRSCAVTVAHLMGDVFLKSSAITAKPSGDNEKQLRKAIVDLYVQLGMSHAEVERVDKNDFYAVVTRLKDPNAGIKLQRHKQMLKTYKNAFSGEELVEWLLGNTTLESRDAAVGFGQQLVEKGIIRHLNNHQQPFGDRDNHYYGFPGTTSQPASRESSSGAVAQSVSPSEHTRVGFEPSDTTGEKSDKLISKHKSVLKELRHRRSFSTLIQSTAISQTQTLEDAAAAAAASDTRPALGDTRPDSAVLRKETASMSGVRTTGDGGANGSRESVSSAEGNTNGPSMSTSPLRSPPMSPRGLAEPRSPPRSPMTSPRRSVAIAYQPLTFPPLAPLPSNCSELDKVFRELLTSERDFAQTMDIIHNLFYVPLRDQEVISPQELAVIFSNSQTLMNFNREFLRRFEALESMPAEERQIGRVFGDMANVLRMFSFYCSNHPNAVDMLIKLKAKNKMFVAFLEDAYQHPAMRGLQLEDLLIMPVQRLCKYPLFLKELSKKTEQNHPDYINLQNALNKVSEAVQDVNEKKRVMENQRKIVEIQSRFAGGADLELIEPTRRFLREGEFRTVKEDGKLGSKRHLFLFNDILVIARESRAKFFFKALIPMEFCLVWDIKENEFGGASSPSVAKNAFKVLRTDKREEMSVSANTQEEKEAWINDLNDCIAAALGRTSQTQAAIHLHSVFSRAFKSSRKSLGL